MTEQSFPGNDCIEDIIERYGDMVFRLSLARTRSKPDAEDVFQDVFLRLMKNLHKIQSEEHLKAWLIRATINCSTSLLTSSWVKTTEALSEDIPFEDSEKSFVYYAVMELPKKYRTAIHLFYFEGLSIKEIAEVCSASESAVKSWLNRGRNMLKTKLKGEYDYV